jgi:hypothetical protein
MPFQFKEEDGVMVIRTTGVIRLADVELLAAEEDAYFASPTCRGLFLCDCTELKVISPDGADALVERMRTDNPRVAKSAFVTSEATAALQLKRMVRDAGGGDNRAVFHSVAQAWEWLRQVPA